jgi:uncharacterized membrane protein
MWTPLIIVGLLVTPYLVTRLSDVSAKRREWAGVLGLTSVFLFTGIGHFVETESMAQMIPSFLPMRTTAVQVSGVVEIICALALLVPGLRHRTGWLLIWMLLLLLPINVYAALSRVPMGGHAWGPIYLWIRVPLQLFLMAWTYRFATRPARKKPEGDAHV